MTTSEAALEAGGPGQEEEAASGERRVGQLLIGDFSTGLARAEQKSRSAGERV
jgi:hypothetical protein